MIRCISAGSASPAKHGETFTHWPISIHIMETAPQCRPVRVHRRVLMMLRSLANCWVLAARWNVNGSTCDYKLHRGATQLTAPRVYLGHNINICTCAGRHGCGATPEHIHFLSFQPFPILVYAVSVARLCTLERVTCTCTSPKHRDASFRKRK